MRVLAIAVSGAEAALRLARSRERRDRKGRKALTRATRARAKPALRMVVPETADQAESREAVEASPRCSRLSSIPSSVPIRRSAGQLTPASCQSQSPDECMNQERTATDAAAATVLVR